MRGYDPRVLPSHLLPRALAKLRPLQAWVHLLLRLRSRRTTELWIGDSHAMSFNQHVGLAMFMKAPEGQLVLRVGARLMFSLATKGFPPRVHKLAGFIGRFGRPGAFVPYFVAGEIDVRCHLAHRTGPMEFVASYVERCAGIAHEVGASRLVVVVPPPPSRTVPNIEELPVVGSIEERVAAFDRLRDALASAVAATPGAGLLDATAALAAPSGELRAELTEDGCHTNLDGVALVRREVHALGAAG